MQELQIDLAVSKLGECRIPSPMSSSLFVGDDDHVLYHSSLKDIRSYLDSGACPPAFEKGGPRERIFFDPSKLKCGIVTCGGLCPGLNDVIRSVVMSLHHHYGVRTIYGFPYGYEGLAPRYGHVPLELTPERVSRIHEDGGTILGSSRGPQDIQDMVDTLDRMNVGLLFTVGGDGTLRGAEAISREIAARGLKIGVVGIPKTIDNDISFVERSFGFETAITETGTSITSAHVEAIGARNGVGLIRLMGRESGFIAALATLAHNDVNFCLVPEVPFTLEGFLRALEARLQQKGHAVIVVGEGAGQDLLPTSGETDASGNLRLGDIGLFLKDRILKHFKGAGKEVNLKYFDPGYTIRSRRSNAHDSAFCLLLGQNAVHCGMAGRTNVVVGVWKGEITQVPIPLATSRRKKIDPAGWLWNSVLAATGQPGSM